MTELQKTLREALIVSLRELENQNSENDQLLGALVSDRDILERLPTALTHLEKILVGALNSVNKTLDDSSRTVNGLNTKLAGLLEDEIGRAHV